VLCRSCAYGTLREASVPYRPADEACSLRVCGKGGIESPGYLVFGPLFPGKRGMVL
jgi:hypothetical protein